jgi:hypothetical protein
MSKGKHIAKPHFRGDGGDLVVLAAFRDLIVTPCADQLKCVLIVTGKLLKKYCLGCRLGMGCISWLAALNRMGCFEIQVGVCRSCDCRRRISFCCTSWGYRRWLPLRSARRSSTSAKASQRKPIHVPYSAIPKMQKITQSTLPGIEKSQIAHSPPRNTAV